jgi:hypothetical protein
MENFTKEDWTIGGLALVLVIVLVALPWFSVGPLNPSGVLAAGGSLPGTGDPDGFLGVVAVLALLALIADLAIERLSPQTQLPALAGGRTATRFVIATATAVFMGLKFLFQLSHFSDLGYGFWLGVIVVAGLVYTTVKANGGTVSLPSMPKPKGPRS